jgi:hypothetical protein
MCLTQFGCQFDGTLSRDARQLEVFANFCAHSVVFGIAGSDGGCRLN